MGEGEEGMLGAYSGRGIGANGAGNHGSGSDLSMSGSGSDSSWLSSSPLHTLVPTSLVPSPEQ